MNRRQFLTTAATAASAALAGPVFAQPPRFGSGDDLPDFAEKAARSAFGLLAGKLPVAGRVAVFAPGDAEGRFTLAIQEASRILQGELIYNLINLARGRFNVLDKAALAQAFAKAGVKPDAVSRTDAKATGAALAKLGFDAAVLGTIDTKSAAAAMQGFEVGTALQVAFKDGTSRPLAGKLSADAIPSEKSHTLPRVRPEVWLAPEGGQPTKLPLFTSAKAGSPYAGVLFAALPSGLALGTPAAQYKVRLTNTGTGSCGNEFEQPTAEREARRLFTVALAVDGVNSVYQDRGDGAVGPVMVDPRSARRWVLTGPGLKIAVVGPRPTDFRLEPSAGTGHSVTDVKGFQKDAQTALAFTFAEAGESIAASAGGIHDVGVIAATVFAQKLSGDENIFDKKGFVGGAAGMGTKAGAAKRSPTVRIQVDVYPDPVARYRIVYRPEADIPIPAAERKEV